jgi:hypothetical protein
MPSATTTKAGFPAVNDKFLVLTNLRLRTAIIAAANAAFKFEPVRCLEAPQPVRAVYVADRSRAPSPILWPLWTQINAGDGAHPRKFMFVLF